MEAQLIQQFNTISNENLLSFGSMFEEVEFINKMAGSTDSSMTYSQDNPFVGKNCIYSYNDTTNTDLVCSFGGMSTVINRNSDNKPFFLSIAIRQNQNALQYYPLRLTVDVSVNGTFTNKSLEITLPTVTDSSPDDNLLRNKWYVFWCPIGNLNLNDVVNFKFTHHGVNNIQGFSELWFDALCLQFNDRGTINKPSTYTNPANVIKKTQNIDFDSVVSGASNVKTFTFDNAKTYNQVNVLPTPAIRALGGTFVAWCGTDGNVSVKYTNNTGSTVDLPSDNYIITLTK